MLDWGQLETENNNKEKTVNGKLPDLSQCGQMLLCSRFGECHAGRLQEMGWTRF